MNKFVLVASVALLASCTAKNDAAADSTASESADFVGTYVERDAAGKVTAHGKATVRDGKICETPEGGKEVCRP
ncbi:MAG TPA: hypothetical protein VHG29_00565 [Novosphingobium sp.]|nr:hypothetical protein [Novosphingobium sp.]